MFKFLSILILLVTLSSCDPGFSVVLSNKSMKERNIKVITVNEQKLTYLDSISIVDSRAQFKIPVLRNKNERSYAFALQPGKEAILQGGIGGPDLREKVIVDGTDTILLKGDKRVHIKKHWLGTAVTIMIE